MICKDRIFRCIQNFRCHSIIILSKLKQVQFGIFLQTEYGIFMTAQKDNFSEKSSNCKPDRYSSVKHVSICAFHIVVQINATVLHDM